jgi:hypothetical protein
MEDIFEKAMEDLKINGIKPGEVDPTRFNDPIALKTNWSKLIKEVESIRTHDLVNEGYNLVYKPAKFEIIFCTVFLCLSFVVLIYALKETFFLELPFRPLHLNDPLNRWVIILLSTAFTAGAGHQLIKIHSHRVVIDKTNAEIRINNTTPVKFQDVKALQVLMKTERRPKSKGSFDGFEINIIFHDANRINLINQGYYMATMRDANVLAEVLNVPVWDGTPYFKQ